MQGMKWLGVFVVGASLMYGGVKGYDHFWGEERFTHETMIANQVVANVSKSNAEEQLVEAISDWKEDGFLYVEWAGQLNVVSKEDFEFDLPFSINAAQDGTSNTLQVALPLQVVTSAIQTITDDSFIQQVDVPKLQEHLVDVATSLENGTFTFSLQDYFNESATVETIEETVIQNGLSFSVQQELRELFNTDREINVLPMDITSLANWLMSEEIKISDESASVIASLVNQLIAATNFEIKERHISPTLPTYATLGYEARFEKERMDYKWLNPNNSKYVITLSFVNNMLRAELEGTALSTEITVETNRNETFAPKKIVQYSPTVRTGQTTVKEVGEQGKIIELVRTVKDSSGEVLKKETISADYYPPVHRVEVKALIASTSTTPPGNTGNTNNTGEQPNNTGGNNPNGNNTGTNPPPNNNSGTGSQPPTGGTSNDNSNKQEEKSDADKERESPEGLYEGK
ncbi:hypothetical protein [Sutcliffiella cohnii]|uniref:hypothetical protein n=1 Tax=Sutcliffiella cohnii TaxID=33932 RepID=UPI002E24C4EB|nr:hypothetical protein [Sutcliffiella cohnii]